MIVRYHDVHILFHHTAFDTTDRDTTDIVVIVNGRNKDLQFALFVSFRRRDMINNGLEQRFEVGAGFVLRIRRCARTPAAIYNGTVDLLVVGVQFDKQVVNFV